MGMGHGGLDDYQVLIIHPHPVPRRSCSAANAIRRLRTRSGSFCCFCWSGRLGMERTVPSPPLRGEAARQY